jgi:hypothetical protein
MTGFSRMYWKKHLVLPIQKNKNRLVFNTKTSLFGVTTISVYLAASTIAASRLGEKVPEARPDKKTNLLIAGARSKMNGWGAVTHKSR